MAKDKTPSNRPREAKTVPVMEEDVSVSKRERTDGRVRVATQTESFEDTVEAALESIEARITRVEIGRYLEADEPVPEPHVRDGLTIVPILEEVLVVEKRVLLREELHIERYATVEEVSVPVTIRKQKATIERFTDTPTETDSKD